VNGDHVGSVAKLGETRITRKVNVNTSKGLITETDVKHGAATFEP